jgi:hypothetical protein
MQLCYFEYHFGTIPNGIEVCHLCDMNYARGNITYHRCVNPMHLYLGTHAQNIADTWRNGRQNILRGDKHPHAKLTTPQVIEILTRFNSGISSDVLAQEYKVSKWTIKGITTKRSWQHIVV